MALGHVRLALLPSAEEREKTRDPAQMLNRSPGKADAHAG